MFERIGHMRDQRGLLCADLARLDAEAGFLSSMFNAFSMGKPSWHIRNGRMAGSMEPDRVPI